MKNFRTSVQKKPNIPNQNQNQNHFNINMNMPQNPILAHPINFSNFNNMSSMNNQMNNQMSNQMNNFNNNNNLNPMSLNPMSNMNFNMNFMNNNMNNNINNNLNNSINNNMNNNMSINSFNNNINNMNMNNMSLNNQMNMNNFNQINNSNNLNSLTFQGNANRVNNSSIQFNQNQNQNNNNQINSNSISTKYKCNICQKAVNKPKKCPYCQQLSCADCIRSYLLSHETCMNCKNKISINDMPNASLDDDRSNVSNIQKINIGKPENKRFKNKSMLVFNDSNRGDNNNNLYNILNEDNIQNQNLCPLHNNKIEFYCVHCDHNYCSSCFLIFSPEAKKHNGHVIVPISKLNNPNINRLISEYKKLTQTKSNMDDIIGTCNYKIRENYIKRNEFESYLSLIKDSYMKKLDQTFEDLYGVLNNLKTQKEKIENSIGSIPNGFNNIVSSNDHVQGGLIFEELKKLNNFDQNLENNIKQLAKSQPKIFVENYQSDLMEINIPFSGQYNEGIEILNKNLNFIPDNKCVLIMKYLANKVFISISIDINMPLNSINFPKFYCYITIQNQKYGLEFNNLPAQSFPQDVIRPNIGSRNFQQINTTEIDFGQFMFLGGDDKTIKMKIYAMKVYFKN